MRVTTDFWVSALVRRVFAEGGFAAVLRRGATEAGAVFVLARSRLGTATLYGPAPQSSYDEARPTDRVFAEVLRSDDPVEIDKRLERETRFDPDLWLIEIEADETTVESLVPTAPVRR